MSAVAAEPPHFLAQPLLDPRRQVPIAAIPQVPTAIEPAGHPNAVGVDRVRAKRFGVQRRQLALPIVALLRSWPFALSGARRRRAACARGRWWWLFVRHDATPFHPRPAARIVPWIDMGDRSADCRVAKRTSSETL